MANLLDSASIVLTPTAYDNGRMLSVKPNTDLLGAELLTQPVDLTTDFQTNTSGTVIVDADTFTTSGGTFDGIRKLSLLTVGKKYRLVIEGDTTSSGFTLGSNAASGNEYGIGFGTHYFTAVINSNLWVRQQTAGTTNITSFSIKEDLSGDFDFSRNSAATRVNAQGLVENVQILSGNLVSNGDFSQEGVEEVSNGSFSQEGAEQVTNGDFATDTDWTKVTGWSISGGTANALSVGSGQSLSQGTSIVASKIYRVDYTVSNFVEGGVYVRVGNSGTGTIRQENGTYTEYITQSGNTTIYFTAYSGSTTLSIDNVSVKEVGQDWTFNGEAEITEQGARILSTSGSFSSINQYGILIVGKQYKLTFDVVSSNGAGLTINNGDLINIPTPLGSNTHYFQSSLNSLDIKRAGGITDVTITNISVKEVGQDWLLVNATIGNDLVLLDADVANAQITQSSLGSTNSLAKLITFTTLSSSDEVTQMLRVSQNIAGTSNNIYTDDNGVSLSAIGVHKVTISKDTSTNDTLFLRLNAGANRIVSLSNFSVIEITDDTNLPRINYEGFSYQDSLGSELVTNGDFATDTDWNKSSEVTIQNGAAVFTLAPSGQQLSQSVTPTIGKQYKITYEIKSITQGAFDVSIGSDISTSYNNSVGVYTEYLTATSTNSFYVRSRGVTNGSIDNVSVKEYFGQEVVPDSGCGSWLLEPQSTNLVTYSEDFSQWQTLGGSSDITYISDLVNPDGSIGGYKISGQGIYVPLSLAIGTERNIYARTISGTGTAKLLSHNSNTNNTFNLTEDWQRFDLNSTPLIPENFYVDLRGAATTLTELYVWGANATNDQDYPTSYIPTNGAASTRLQDLANNSGNASLINSTEGVLYAEIETFSQTGTIRQINLNNKSTSSRIYISKRAENDLLEFRMDNPLGNLNFNFPINTTNQFIKVAFRYGVNNFAVFIDGVNKNVTPNGNTFSAETLNNLELNSPLNQPFYGKVKAVVVYKEALTDEQLTCLTTI